MKNLLFILFTIAMGSAWAAERRIIDPSQENYERTVSSVVRKKLFYKSSRIELTPKVGLTPYDSVINHYLFGGTATWHFSDHYGWEVIDLQLALPSVTSFTTNLVNSKSISNLQATQLKFLVSSSFLLSPLYGKVRFAGSTVIYFDIYLSLGLGLARTELVTVSNTAGSSASAGAWDPMINFGFGFKIFLTKAFGLVFDMRDYITYSSVYGSKRFKSNFTTFGGFSLFLPTFD